MKKLFNFIIIIVLCLGLVGCGKANEEVSDTVNKLKDFTTLDKVKDIYEFEYNDSSYNGNLNRFIIRYSEANEAVRLYGNKEIGDIVTNLFEVNCLNEEDELVYDISENEIRMYFDSEAFGNIDFTGGISIISYNIDDEEFIINKDGKKYSASDEFIEFATENNLVDVILKSLDEFKNLLIENNLSLEEIGSLKYSDIENIL